MEVIEPITTCLGQAICDFVRILELQCRVKQLSRVRNAIFHVMLIATFSQINHQSGFVRLNGMIHTEKYRGSGVQPCSVD